MLVINTNQVTQYENAQLIIQICAAFAILATLIIYFLQLRTMQKQLRTMADQLNVSRDSVKSQNMLTLANFLQDSGVRDAREIVIKKLKPKDFILWTTSESVSG